jgi:rhodanese-related sulfurtransferase
MTQKKSKLVEPNTGVRKRKQGSKANLASLSKARLEALIEEALVDAYGDEEQTGGFFTMIEEHLALPFSVRILGVEAVVEKVDLTRDSRIVVVCRHGGVKQRIEILDLPLPKPIPAGAEWIVAYCHWRRGF